ncbi:MAG: twin-arginine translocation pathway signal [Synechococcus sp.]|nr:twin-arginine translocation pathway signal [Synechococcus sp.]
MTLLRRRQWLALTGSALLTACSGGRSHLAVQSGLLPSPWLRRLPRDWSVEPLELDDHWPPLGGQARSVVLSDGWATASAAPPWQPLPAGLWQQGLLPQAAPLLRYGLPLGFGPWLLLLRNRQDLLAGGGHQRGWKLLLDPSLQGQLLLPASPRVVLDIASRIGDPQAVLEQLRRQALGFGDRDALTLLLNGDAQAAVLPSRAVLPQLRRDTRLQALLPASGAPLWWSLLVLPRGGQLPPVDWLLASRQTPLLDQLLRDGFTPPLQRPLLQNALQRQSHPQLLLPPEPLLQRCTTLLPSAPEPAARR